MAYVKNDYSKSVDYASKMKTAADNIMEIFNRIDGSMKEFFEQDWVSKDSEHSYSEYEQIRNNYNKFYEKIVEFSNFVNSAAASGQSEEQQSDQIISGALNG